MRIIEADPAGNGPIASLYFGQLPELPVTSPPSFYINHHFRLFPKRTLTAPNQTQTLNTENRKIATIPMALSKAMFIAVMSVLVAVISAADAPAPSPTSPAIAVSPSFVAGVVAAVAALAFGSSLRI
ncbi:hypothetical protein ACSQ67_000313 [Phaseolus vulgaris]